MTVFSIFTDADETCALCATIQLEQVGKFLAFLRTESQRLNMKLLDDYGEIDPMLFDGFEARVCPLPLAAVARIFDYDPGVITVVDDAQFRARKITIWRDRPSGPIRMCPSSTSDTDAEITLPASQAYALLAGLGIEAQTMGERPVEDIRRRLNDPATPRRLAAEKLDHYLPHLERLLSTANLDETSRFEWC